MNTNPIVEFEEIVNMIVGVYTDATIGFDIYQFRLQQITKNSSPDAKLFFGSGNQNDPATEVDHVAPITEVVSRNMETGSNFRFIGNMCLISIYQYWEDDYRKKIAVLFHKKKDDIKEPIMGDIQKLRNSIIHHKAIALPAVQNCTLLKWYQEGDEIFINKEQFKEIIKPIRVYINKLKSEHKNLK